MSYRLLYLTIPACLLTGWAAARSVVAVKASNAEAVVATFPAGRAERVRFPAAGTYWVFAAASRETMKARSDWEISVVNDSTGQRAIVDRPATPRAERRENRAALDLMFTLGVPREGDYTVQLTPPAAATETVEVRIRRFSPDAASAAMKAFGLAALFSALLVASAAIWFRLRSGAKR